MNKIKKITAKGVGMVVFGILMAAGSASAYTITFDIGSLQHLFADMQTRTVDELYPKQPLKEQMRGKMMLERSSKNYMQDVIQEQMMAANRNHLKPQQVERVVALTQ